MKNDIKLTINIENKKPVGLIDLAIGLSSFAKLYSDFNNGDLEAKLLVKEIRKGSIEIDLVSLSVASAIPIITDVNNIVQFCNYIRLLIAICKKSSQEEIAKITTDNYLPNPTIKDFNNFKDTINIVSDAEDTINIGTNNGDTYINCTFNGKDVAIMKETIRQLQDEPKRQTIFTKQLFTWKQTNFDKTKVGNKGKIENITLNPLKVTFESSLIKEQMTTSTAKPKIDWQKKCYVVDVEVMFLENTPKLYKILNNYPDESFPMDE
jgi:hypothetical protein